jgi:hypothetical protein
MCFFIKMRQSNIYSCNANFRCISSVIQLASTLYQPTTVANIFGNWLNGVDDKFKKHIRVGVIAIIWSLWLCMNDKVFTNKTSSMLHDIYGCTGDKGIVNRAH